MDYDDNDAQDQNLHLSGEGSSKVSPVLHSYPLPRFDFDDNLQEHLRFDSLVENEVFLGITSQEDNHWIEEYSRGTTAIPFNSSVAESRNQNVWSEATSSESVEMLLKSVGQEEKVLEATMVEELDPNLKQSDGDQETEVSHEGLDSVVVGDTYGSSSTLGDEMQEDPSVSKVECEIVGSIQNVDASVEECQNDNPVEVSETLNENASDKTSDDAIKEGSDLANESFVTELQGHSNVSKVECGNAGSSQNVIDSVKVHEMQSENASDVLKNPHSDNLSNDPNEEGSNLSNEPLTNELQKDLSVFKVEREIADSSQNVDANVEENPQEVLETPNENTSDLSQNLNSSEPAHIDEIHDDTNKEDVNLANELQKDPFVSFEGCQENEHASDLSKKLDSVEPENIDKPCDDANQKGSDLGSESLANELHEDLSGNAQNVDESIEECQGNHPQEVIETVNENASDLNIHNSEPLVDKMQEDLSVSKVEDVVTTSIAAEMPAEDILSKDEGAEENIETQSLEPDAVVSMDQDYTLSEKGDAKDPLDLKDTDIDVVEAHDSQKNTEPSSGNNAPNIETEDSNVKISDETQSSEPDAVCMDQDAVCMDMDVDKAPDSQTNDEPSLPIVMAQGSEPNMALVPDTVADVESSKISSLDTHEAGNVTEDQPRSPILGVSLLHEEKFEVTVARADTDTEDIPRSPVLGVSLLPNDDNEGKGEAEGSFQKVTPEVDSSLDVPLSVVKKDADSHSDVGPNEQTADDNPKPLETSSISLDSSTKETNNESMTGKDRVEPLNLTVNMSDEQQQASVPVAGPSENEKDLNKPQIFSFSDMKSIEPSQIAKDKHEVTKGIMENTPLNQVDGSQLVSLNSSTKPPERNFTFELATGHPGIQNLDFSKVSSVSTSVALLDSTKSNKDSQITPPPSESGAKKTTERKPRKKSVGKETAKKTPTRRSGTQKSPTSITTPATVLPNQPQPDLNHPSPILHQSFTDSQQVQLRAQILVYGSLISGTSPEEPHMVAAFGQSESGRKAWEAAWHACIERVHGHKSQINNNPQTPLHLRSGHQEIKTDSPQSKLVVSTPIITGTIVSPMNPISTPLWNISTPHDRLHSTAPRSPLFDYRQSLSPLHSFQTQQRVPPQTFSGNTPSWPSGQWVASLPVSPFGPRFSSLPITEAVKLTTVKESGASGVPVLPPVDPTSNESKSRKRKKPTATSITNITNIPAVPSPTPVAFLTPVSTPKTNQFLSALSSPGPTHGQTKPVDRNIEKSEVVAKDETLSKIEESKLQATEAAEHAAVAVKHCQDVWTQLEKQKSCGLVPDDESKLASSAVSIAAAASVAKVAAAAAKLASNVAEQARLMADEVFLSSTHNKSTTPDHSSSVLSVAREAARRRIEAASAASKHAENLDAVVKAAELAAEAVAQAGKIVAMGKPLSLSELVDKGPEGYWKSPQKVSQSGSSGKKIPSLKHGLSLSLQDEHYEKDKSKVRVPDLGIGPMQPVHARDVDQVMMTESRKDNNITEGCLVEVYRDDNKNRGAWFAANVLALNDGKAFVCYTEIQSDEGSGKLKEWVPLEAEGSESPRVRMAHPMTTLRFEGAKKRGRTVLTDYSWCSGDHVDVWVQDSWQEAVVVETNKIDLTSLSVQFPAQGKTSVVRSWHVRPTLVYKDGKWIEWSSSKGHHSSEGDTPQEKRQKYDKEKEKPWNSVDIETAGHQESRIPTFITQKSSFDIGSMDDNKQKTRGPIRGGLQKERSRVVFGVPKPGKKQKFMDVSRHYVGDGSNKNSNNTNNSNPPNNSVKKIFVNDSKEKQVAEVSKSKPPPKFRKPPVPTLARTLPQKDKPKPSVSEKSVSGDGNLPGQQNDDTPKQSSSSRVVSEHRLNKRKIPSGNLKASKVEVKENLTSESEPRRSNRKIQPTSRLLEGLQSSLTISKMPTVSKVMSKGSPRPG
ncbi:hypothetical protein LXL04_029762 [Taraxacum kok-saghyz]